MPRTALTPATRPPSPAKARHTSKQSVLDLGLELFQLQEKKRAAKQQLRELDEREVQLCEQLARDGVAFGETVAKGKLRIKRSWREAREELALTDARRQGALTAFIEKRLKPFLRRGEPYEVWETKLLPKALPDSEAA